MITNILLVHLSREIEQIIERYQTLADATAVRSTNTQGRGEVSTDDIHSYALYAIYAYSAALRAVAYMVRERKKL